MMDTYDMIVYDVDEDEDRTMVEYKTIYANKDELSEEDKQTMARKRQYYEDLFETGA